MRSLLSKVAGAAAVAIVCGLTSSSAHAVAVSVTPSSTLLNFINVSELPANGGGYIYGQPYSLSQLQANYVGTDLNIGPMTINDSSNFWFQGAGSNPGGPGVAGNKNIDASAYVETTDVLNGQTVTFTGHTVSNSLVAPYTSVAFIRDFAPDYSSNNVVTMPLVAGQNFSLSLATNAAAGRHVQYGFETIGPDVWVTDGATKGFVVVNNAVPEPTTLAAAGAAGLLLRRRRRA